MDDHERRWDRRVDDGARLAVIETNLATHERTLTELKGLIAKVEERLWLLVVGSLGSLAVSVVNAIITFTHH